MNHNEEHHEIIDSLERLAERHRAEADDGFESRILDAATQPLPAHRHQRKTRSTAWIPFATAAAVGVFAYMWFPRSAIPVPGQEDDQVVAAATPDESSAADLWLVSIETMEELIAGSDDFGDSLEWIELQIDATESEFDSELDWYQIGESL
ncbi:MAG: hypothetical protein ED559_07170 [Phycisphaera sp.]|nr:MAG: hypothetical protein ED559_07170 [Phycisphaera sp.]